ncbi:MAG: 16S rRNA (adenine(1518)-N(6)/adenine(1519)-N(6))-dimethyltransferase RsmA [Anaerolineae bacterium]
MSKPELQLDDPRTILHRYDLWPRKSLGQNFLVDPTAPARIAACADLGPEDTVLEVGAGVGALTAALAARAGRVIAVETDPQLVEVLHEELGGLDNVEIVHGDIMELKPSVLLGIDTLSDEDRGIPLWGPRLPHYRVVSNLPYYITNAVVRHLLEADVRPAQMVLTVQREVAQRMAAKPGDMSLLSVSVQLYGDVRRCLRLGRGAFHPVPNVDSAVVRIDVYEDLPISVGDVGLFFEIARAGFAQRRKQLRNSLSSTLQLDPNRVEAALEAQGIDHRRRAETLSIEAWGKVYAGLAPLMAQPDGGGQA